MGEKSEGQESGGQNGKKTGGEGIRGQIEVRWWYGGVQNETGSWAHSQNTESHNTASEVSANEYCIRLHTDEKDSKLFTLLLLVLVIHGIKVWKSEHSEVVSDVLLL